MTDYVFAQFRFDSSRGTLLSDSGDKAELRHKVANLLAYLITHSDRVVSKEELLQNLWHHGDYRENSLTQSIRELRRALGDDARNSYFVKTYPQRGYQWICPLQSEALNARTTQQPLDPDLAEPLVCEETPAPSYKSKTENTFLRRVTAAALLCAILIAAYFIQSGLNKPEQDTNGLQADAKSLLVLPLINATDDASMAWLELGLADMLAIDIQRSNQLQVTPPATANALLLGAELDWPTLPIHIRSLLREHNIDAALFGSVRIHRDQQVLDFQLLRKNGKTQQGSISYPSLPAFAQSIAQQILHLLQPGQGHKQKYAEENPISAQALAEGMQALQQGGALDAQRYFEAAMLLEPNNQWARAYLARSRYALGDWQAIDTLLNHVPLNALQQDASLSAFVHYWRAELSYRRGQSDMQDSINLATQQAESAADAKQMARSYRLQADLAFSRMDWPAHAKWLQKADRLFSRSHDLHIEAEKLFYLGNPINEGLEKNPQNDLLLNQQRLLKALNFYEQLGNKPMIAASQFAIAQNYTLKLSERELALDRALSLYRELKQPYELAQTLVYAGFFQIQLHDGSKATEYFVEAKSIAQKLGAQRLSENSDFYIAFATLDQGLDQTGLGGHGQNPEKLKQAIDQLTRFIASKPAKDLEANALVFLGWANADLHNYDLALSQLNQAKTLNQQMNMPTTFGYSSYSIMRIHLAREDYEKVTAMANEPITTRLQASFLARAHYENAQTDKAVGVMESFKQELPQLWQREDSERLALYRSVLQGHTAVDLGAEPLAHLVYCEADWAP